MKIIVSTNGRETFSYCYRYFNILPHRLPAAYECTRHGNCRAVRNFSADSVCSVNVPLRRLRVCIEFRIWPTHWPILEKTTSLLSVFSRFSSGNFCATELSETEWYVIWLVCFHKRTARAEQCPPIWNSISYLPTTRGFSWQPLTSERCRDYNLCTRTSTSSRI